MHSWMTRGSLSRLLVALAVVALLSGCGRRRKYENPITKDTQQPDKVLFDKAVKDLERNRFEVARLTLNTLMNTYDTSEYLAKAKLAFADSYYREGGAHGLAQAEAEYKDFILFYPNLEESAEAQYRVCNIHYRQMEKADRDMNHAYRAEDECRQLVTQFPNSKYAPQAQQVLRNIQEVIGGHEYRVGSFYHRKGSNPAAANRLQNLVDQYPLYSQSDDALMQLADSYSKMGPRFRDKAGQAYARLVRDYPLSGYSDEAKRQLTAMEMPIPEPDPVAVARMKYEVENATSPGMVRSATGFLRKGPDVSAAAKSGAPAMTGLRPTVPASVPVPAGATGFSGDVTVGTVGDSSALANNPDARMGQGAGQGAAAAPAAGQAATPATPDAGATATPVAAPSANQALPSNRAPAPQKQKKVKKGKESAK